MTVSKQNKDGVLLLKLSGTLEEGVDLNTLVGETPSEVVVSCKEIQRINSAGVRIWMQYFGGLRNKGTKLKLIEVSPAILEQINLIINFSSDAIIESVYVPFSCGGCKAQFVSLFQTEELKKIYKQLPEPSCPKCKGKTCFDDIEDEYFQFLTR